MNQFKHTDSFFLSALPYFLFFLISFIYFLFFAEHIFFYQEKSSLFLLSTEYLLQNLDQPGGFLKYLGNFFSAFFRYPVAGSLIISAVLSLFIFYILRIIKLPGNSRSLFVPLTAGVALFLLQTNYQYLFYNNLGLLLQVMLFCLTARRLKGWMPAALIPLWYFLIGGFAWIYILMYTVYQIFIVRGVVNNLESPL